MMTEQKLFDEYDDAEFLEMCRLAAGEDTGGQWTDEKIDAIDTVKANARFAVRRLFALYTAQRQRAEAAETVLAAGMWKNAGQCPLCSAEGSRAIHDPTNDVRVTYCLHCETAVLWMPDKVQAERNAGRGYVWGDCAVQGGGEPD